MDLDLTDDQRAILDALDSLCKPFENAPIHDAPLAATSQELERAIVEGGFLDVAFDPDLGTVTGDGISYPLCLVEDARWTRPVRFLREGASVVQVGDGVSLFTAGADQVRPEPEALFAYPVAPLLSRPAEVRSIDVSQTEFLTRWRVGLAAETAGLLAAALNVTCLYLTERQQFGRPLATFQALRHRLSEAQVRTNGVYWLAMKAAASLDPADAALAALHAQESARHCVYDFHQFLGAMGMTLEHPLHLWTYRLKLLIGELGGRGAQALAAAEASWG